MLLLLWFFVVLVTPTVTWMYSCPKEVKAAAYTTLVRPSIEYASSVWDPYTRNNIHQLEAIHRRAARFVYNNFYDREPGVVTSIQECILRLRKPMVRLAFADMLLIWLVQLKSELNVSPRYVLSLVTSSMWFCRV
jgi:hypothetical protein